MSNEGYAVIDVETTGLFPGGHDRVIEIGVVLLDHGGQRTGEWTSLVNPRRDLGPQHIHGILSKDVLGAPSFTDIAGDLGERLRGRVIVAHNLGFDLRFLVAEYERLGMRPPLGFDLGLCTMRLSGRYLDNAARSLAACCASAGFRHDRQHSALHDARACADLLTHFIDTVGRPEPWRHLLTAPAPEWPPLPVPCGRSAPRSSAGDQPVAFLARLIDRLPRVAQPPRADEYLAVLDRALLDRILSASEQEALIDVATALGLTFGDALELHRSYLSALAEIALSDGVVTDDERLDMHAVAELLGLTEHDVDVSLRTATIGAESPRWARFTLCAGDVVAFTGQMAGSRKEWENRATRHGLKVTGNGVTRRTRLLVAADPDSLSGKAATARQHDIPIVSVEAFGTLLDRMTDTPRVARPAAVASTPAPAGAGTVAW